MTLKVLTSLMVTLRGRTPSLTLRLPINHSLHFVTTILLNCRTLLCNGAILLIGIKNKKHLEVLFIFGDPFALCFEHFLPWIHTLMLAYHTQTESKEVKYALPSRSLSHKSLIRVN